MSKFVPYKEQLLDPRWQKRRLEVMQYANWRCQVCGADKKTLHCHHSYYTKGKMAWQYPKGAIICVCEDCHRKIHPEKTAVEAPPPSPESSHAQIYVKLVEATRTERKLISAWFEVCRLELEEVGRLVFTAEDNHEHAAEFLQTHVRFFNAKATEILGTATKVEFLRNDHPEIKRIRAASSARFEKILGMLGKI